MRTLTIKSGAGLLLLVLALASCRSSKEAAGAAGKAGRQEPVEWVNRLDSAALKTGTVTSKLHLDLNLDGKTLSVGGNCNLKRDEVIQLSLVALGFMEVGRLEFTPQYLMMVNRMERQYVRVDYADVPYLQQAGIDFYSLQSLFWGDLFVPGKHEAWTETDFDVEQVGENAILTSHRDGGLLQCRFVVDVLTGLVRNTSVTVPGQPSLPRLDWAYLHFASVDQKSFPDKMQLSVTGGGNLTAIFSLDNLKWNAKTVELTKEPGGKYQRVPADVILKQLIK